MKLGGNTVLITGGATGIGFALAEEFVRAGSEVIVCARTEENLKQAKDNAAPAAYEKMRYSNRCRTRGTL